MSLKWKCYCLLMIAWRLTSKCTDKVYAKYVIILAINLRSHLKTITLHHPTAWCKSLGKEAHEKQKIQNWTCRSCFCYDNDDKSSTHIELGFLDWCKSKSKSFSRSHCRTIFQKLNRPKSGDVWKFIRPKILN